MQLNSKISWYFLKIYIYILGGLSQLVNLKNISQHLEEVWNIMYQACYKNSLNSLGLNPVIKIKLIL